RTVTGVQTCALPICDPYAGIDVLGGAPAPVAGPVGVPLTAEELRAEPQYQEPLAAAPVAEPAYPSTELVDEAAPEAAPVNEAPRSEERRVGKEGRCG